MADHRVFSKRILFLLLFWMFLTCAAAGNVYAASSAKETAETESLADRRFKKRAAQYPATKKNRGKILVAGSSTMQLWAARSDNPLAQYGFVNMSVPGTSTNWWLRWYKKAIVKYKPSIVVLYMGVSDAIKSKDRAAHTANNVKKLISCLRKELPDTWIFYVSIVVPPDKEDKYPNTVKYTSSANKEIQSYCSGQRRVTYISIADKFKKKGKVNRKLFRADDLHPNEEGMQIWNRLVGKRVARQAKRMGLKKISMVQSETSGKEGEKNG